MVSGTNAGANPGTSTNNSGTVSAAIAANVPAVADGKLMGIRWAPLSARSSYARVYSDTGTPNEVRSQLTAASPPAGEQDSDVALFGKGYATLTLLDGDVSISTSATAPVTSRLSKLALPQPAAPR